jgi:hypothetical protein
MNSLPCDACGDPSTVDWRGKHYCFECYSELAHGRIRFGRAKLDSSGPGCPLEPNIDDASPWQDKVIRELEEN